MVQRDLSRYYILSFIFLLAAALRFYQIGFESLYWDELYTWELVNSSIAGLMEPTPHFDGTIMTENNPPLYYILISLWSSILGFSDAAIRSLSAIASVFTVVYMYLIGSEISEFSGYVAAMFSTISFFHIWYAQDARFYALFLLFSVMSMYYLIRLQDSNTKAISVAYLLSTTAMLYTHTYATFVFASQVIYIIWKYRKSVPPRITRSVSYTIALFIPGIIFLFDRMRRIVSNGFWIPEPTLDRVMRTFIEYISVPELIPFYALLVLLAIPIPFAGRFAIEKLENRDTLMLIWLWLIVSISAPFVFSVFIEPIYLTKFTISASAALYLIVAYGVNRLNSTYLQAFFLIVIFAVSLQALHTDYYDSTNKEQWRQSINFMDSKSGENPKVLYNNDGVPYGFLRYSDIDDYDLQKIPRNGGIITRGSVGNLSTYTENSSEVWLFLYTRQNPEFLIHNLNESYSKSEEVNLDSLERKPWELTEIRLYRFWN